MTRIVHLCCAVALLALAVSAAPAVAQERAGEAIGSDDGQLARLEARLQAQQEYLDQLEAQVAAVSQEDADQTREEMMRQQIREVLDEQGFRESLMPSMLQAGYDKGFFIRSSDDKFLMKVNGYVQFRWTHCDTSSRNRYLQPRLERDDRTGFDLQRVRLRFSGHAYSKDLTYLMEMRSGAGTGYDTRLFYSWVNYRFADELQFKAGMFKIAATRAQMISWSNQQFVERPMTDTAFSLGRGLGVRFWGRLFDKRLDWYLDVVNALGSPDNRTITTDGARELDNNPAIVFHAIWHALGENPGDLMKSQSDIAFHETPALDLGIHYAFNDDAGDARTLRIPFRRFSPMPGAYGQTTSNGLQLNQLGVDAAFQWQGFSATAEYMWRFIDPRRAGRTPFTPYWLLTGDGSDSSYHGGYLQVGYFLPIPGLEKKIEVAGRVGGVSGIGPGGDEGSWEYAGGLNYFIDGHKIKLQTDVTKIYESPVRTGSGSIPNVNDDVLVWRIQLQVKF